MGGGVNIFQIFFLSFMNTSSCRIKIAYFNILIRDNPIRDLNFVIIIKGNYSWFSIKTEDKNIVISFIYPTNKDLNLYEPFHKSTIILAGYG